MRPDSDHDDDNSSAPTSFGQRHGVTIMTIVLFSLLILVIIVDTAC